MRPGDLFDYVPLERRRQRLTTSLDVVIGVGCAAVLLAWIAGRPLFWCRPR